MSESAIQLENLSVGYKGNALFGPFDIEVTKGTMNLLVGANGAGKSTLLQTVGGVIPPISGVVRISGEELGAMSHRRKSQIMSLVYTERFNAGGLTVRELVSMGRYPYTGILGRLSSQDIDLVRQAMVAVGIEHKSDEYLSDVSDGERQKAMIAKALAQNTPILILDEPTNFLDVASRLEILGLIGALVRERNITAILSTHDIGAAIELAHNVMTILPNDTKPVALDSAGSPEANSRLNRIFAERGVKYDSERHDFILGK